MTSRSIILEGLVLGPREPALYYIDREANGAAYSGMKGSAVLCAFFSICTHSLPFLPVSPLECTFQNKTGTEPFIPEYPANVDFVWYTFYLLTLNYT